jgi:protein subunit release factor A
MTRRYLVGCDVNHPDRRGGQHVGMCLGVLAIGEQTGLGVRVVDERSQYKNKAKADTLLDWMLELTKETP